ncbi:hypothetical protein AALO_G00212940 [Alosa alosa]|uniref:Uncharacterized protein n=1 Tax=Alosa alosa TaxID=278164 RepID=A0AAV6G0K9_9TELE|nr:hypothetical protein AALO_G00212940 [Alosa alosa]
MGNVGQDCNHSHTQEQSLAQTQDHSDQILTVLLLRFLCAPGKIFHQQQVFVHTSMVLTFKEQTLPL